MLDKLKIGLAILFFIGAVTLPLIGVATTLASLFGWLDQNPLSLILLTIASFLLLFLIGSLLLYSIEEINWLTVSLPYLVGAIYGVLPDLLPIAVDDAAATTAGAIFTFLLAVHKNPRIPKWILVPLLVAGVYALIGGTIPGPLDELLVDLLALLAAGYGMKKSERNLPTSVSSEDRKGL